MDPERRATAGVGDRIGGIRLVEQIGSGGMGCLFLGADERLGRKVAVKAVRAEQRLDEVTRARFLREARLLSQLEHPNICRLYDLVEEGGEQYLVLELVPGRSLRDEIPEAASRGDRFRIVEQIGVGLVAAHAMSIVHRDLKPENIMVAADGSVKILDFGLARAVPSDAMAAAAARSSTGRQPGSERLGDEGWTRLGDVMGTPRYMSPEQARGEPVTAASDIYSFGLIVAELFTGRPPYRDDLGLTSLQHHARWGDVEPVRGLAPALARLVADMTAFRPQNRPSAEAVVDRLRAIRDRPRRLAARALVAGIVASLALGLAASTVALRVAREARSRAETSERDALDAQGRAEAVNRFLQDMLASPDPKEMGRDVRVLDVLERAVASADRSLADEPLVLAEVLNTLGNTYLALGEPIRAEALFARTTAIVTDFRGPDSPEGLAGREGFALARLDQGSMDEAERLLRELLQDCREQLGDDHEWTASAVEELAVVVSRRGRIDEARELISPVLRRKRRELGEDDESTLRTRMLYANLLARGGSYEEAERAYRELLTDSRRVLGKKHPDTLVVTSNLVATLVRELRRYAEAEPMLDDLISGCRGTFGDRHHQTLRALEHRAILLRGVGQLEQSERVWRDLLAARRETVGDAHPETLATRASLAWVLAKRHRYAQAEEELREVVAAGPSVYGGADHPEHLTNLANLGNMLLRSGRFAEAEQVFRRASDGYRGRLGDLHPRTLSARNSRASCLQSLGRLAEAEQELREVVHLERVVLGPDHPNTVNALANLGLVLAALGKAEEAEACLCECFETAALTRGLDHPLVGQLQDDLHRVASTAAEGS